MSRRAGRGHLPDPAGDRGAASPRLGAAVRAGPLSAAIVGLLLANAAALAAARAAPAPPPAAGPEAPPVVPRGPEAPPATASPPAPLPTPPRQLHPPPPIGGPPPARRPRSLPALPVEPRLAAFSGLSTWVDVYDVDAEPEAQAAAAAAGGAQLLFAQSGKYDSPADLHDPDRLGRLLEAAHDRGLRVVVWYTPDFVDLPRDLLRAQAAIAFVSPRGDRPDGFGLDIEVEDLPDAAERTRRLLGLSDALRSWTGHDYPLAAIVLPPLQLQLRPQWWPNFPYPQLAATYDVFVPMSYSSFRGTDPATTYHWNAGNVAALREAAGDPALPVHLAGGIADDLSEVGAFVRAARGSEVLGAGLYDLHTTPPQAWPRLRRLRATE